MGDDLEQKLVIVTQEDGQYSNFFWTPGSIGSLHSYLCAGWKVKFIKDDGNKACVLLEREVKTRKGTQIQSTEVSYNCPKCGRISNTTVWDHKEPINCGGCGFNLGNLFNQTRRPRSPYTGDVQNTEHS